MLGGVAPILIFLFPPALGIDLTKTLGGIPVIGSLFGGLAIPIPIYLDENVTGIYIESESKALDIDTDVTPTYRKTGEVENYINRSGINNLVTINMIAEKNSIFLAVLLALNDMIFAEVVGGKYRMTYINGTTLIFNGLLHSFSVNANSDDTLLKITMQIQKNNQNKPNIPTLYIATPAVTGVLPP